MPHHRAICNLGENALLAHLQPYFASNKELLLGPGDDCAVAQGTATHDFLLKTDCVIENRHFLPDTPPQLIGRKALARAISDIAAMGGYPRHALITLLADPQRPLAQIEQIYQGIHTLARQFNISIAGGECASLPAKGLILSVSMTGIVPRGTAITRHTAQVHDLLAVTGTLGGSFRSGKHLTFTPRVHEGAVLRASGLITAMMDLSDGLAADLPRLASASNLGFHLNTAALPLTPACTYEQALQDGEDYELLFTFPPTAANAVFALAAEQFPQTPVHIIGNLTPYATHSLPIGWDHFKQSPDRS